MKDGGLNGSLSKSFTRRSVPHVEATRILMSGRSGIGLQDSPRRSEDTSSRTAKIFSTQMRIANSAQYAFNRYGYDYRVPKWGG